MNPETAQTPDSVTSAVDRIEDPTPRLDMTPAMERRAFEDPHVQGMFTEWYDVNDSIEPVYVDREEWNRRVGEGHMLAEVAGADGKRELAIPTDLHLWEMVSVMETVDEDTFGEGSERATVAVKKIGELGETFRDAGTYIAQRLEVIGEDHSARHIAEQLAGQFYNYGQSLLTGQRGEAATTEEIASQPKLAPERQEKIERWLAGGRLYEARRAQALAHDEDLDGVRDWTLDQFFRVTAKSLELQGRDAELRSAPDRKPWQSDVAVRVGFPQRMEKQMTREVTMPEQELLSSAFRRGLDLLQKNMGVSSLPEAFKEYTLHLEAGETTLRGALHIDQLRAELEQVRAGEGGGLSLSRAFAKACEELAGRHSAPDKSPIRDINVVALDYDASTGTNLSPYPKIDRVAALGILTEAEMDELREKFSLEKAIGDKERQIAGKIQRAVSQYVYKLGAARPSQITQEEQLNCVGSSALGGALMQEAGLNYLVAELPRHSALVLVTSDGQVEWRDMQETGGTRILAGKETSQSSSDRPPVTAQMVADFSRHPSNSSLTIRVPKEIHQSGTAERDYRQDPVAFLRHSASGHEVQVLHWAGATLEETGNKEAAVYAYSQAINLDSRDANGYTCLGGVFTKLGRFEESIEACRAAITIDPEEAVAYHRLGVAFNMLARNREALETYQAAVQLDADNTDSSYNIAVSLEYLGRREESIAAYEAFLVKADPGANKDLISSAQSHIARLRRAMAATGNDSSV